MSLWGFFHSVFSSCVLSRLKSKPGPMSKAHISGEAFHDCINLCCPVRPLRWVLLVAFKVKKQRSFMSTPSTRGYDNTKCLPALQFKTVTLTGRGYSIDLWASTKERDSIFVVHIQAALNDRYFTYNEELTLPRSSERHHLFKSPSLISWI